MFLIISQLNTYKSFSFHWYTIVNFIKRNPQMFPTLTKKSLAESYALALDIFYFY